MIKENKDKPAFPTTIAGISYPGMTKQELVSAAIILGGMVAEGKLHEYQGHKWNHFKAVNKMAAEFLYTGEI